MRSKLVVLLTVIGATSAGCVAGNYRIRQDELVRLAHTPAHERWQAVRGTQGIVGGEVPSETFVWAGAHPEAAPYGTISTNNEFAAAAGINVRPSVNISGLVRLAAAVPPHLVLPHITLPLAAPPLVSIPAPTVWTPGAQPGSGTNSGGSSPAGGDLAAAAGVVLVAAAVVASAVAIVVLIPTEAIRYDGYLAVSESEPIYLRLRGQRVAVPLDELDENLAFAATGGASIYEGATPRFPRLGRVPLNRGGLVANLSFVGGTTPVRGGSTTFGFGGRVGAGYNFFGVVSAILAIDALVAGPDSVTTQAFVSVGPEITVYPFPYGGIYVGASTAGRWTWSATELVDAGYTLRAGLAGELPISSLLAGQLRAGISRSDFRDSNTPLTFEASLGFSIY